MNSSNIHDLLRVLKSEAAGELRLHEIVFAAADVDSAFTERYDPAQC